MIHIGLAHWLCERWNTRLWISATDYNAARIAIYDHESSGGEAGADFYRTHGAQDGDFLQHVLAMTSYYPAVVPALPRSYRRLVDGFLVDIGESQWQCISGYGHAPEHIALHSKDLSILISGDMVLPPFRPM